MYEIANKDNHTIFHPSNYLLHHLQTEKEITK